MIGIELDREIRYHHSSLRYFKEGEHHITRHCKDDVLLMVFEGILRFSEDGEEYELHPGDYHIQHHQSDQAGPVASDAPKYLYVHFWGDWSEGETVLPRSGTFDAIALLEEMKELDRLAHSGAPYIAQCSLFYGLLAKLAKRPAGNTIADEIAAYLAREAHRGVGLWELEKEFHFSKNHIINLFKKAYGMTPIAYANLKRLERAEYRMEVTSLSLEEIALSCGFSDYSHFYKLFIKKHGCSPEKWRAQLRTR